MTLSPTLPQAAVDLVVAVLVRLLLPGLSGDTDAAKVLALAMLAEYQPHTIRELGIAGEIIGLGLDSLNALAESAQPGLPAERITNCRRWACGMSRAGHQAQRRLDALQRARQRDAEADRESAAPPRTACPIAAPEIGQAQTAPVQTAPAQTAPAQTPLARTPLAQTPLARTPLAQTAPLQPAQPHIPSAPPAQPAAPRSAAETSLSLAECAYVDALTQLNLLKARYKGAPPPHSQAAQHIQTQQRIVDAARMKLELLRKTPQPATSQSEPVRAAA